MVKKLKWFKVGQSETSIKGSIDGLRLFRAYISTLAHDNEYSLWTTLPVGDLDRDGETLAMKNLVSRDVAMQKAQMILERFADTLDSGQIEWQPPGFVRPQMGSIGGINLFTITPMSGGVQLETRLPIDPGGVATVRLASTAAAEKKAEQMIDQFADHLGIVFKQRAS